jgi:hypothetical protein
MLNHLENWEGITRLARKADEQPGTPRAWIARKIVVNPDVCPFDMHMHAGPGILDALEYFHAYMVQITPIARWTFQDVIWVNTYSIRLYSHICLSAYMWPPGPLGHLDVAVGRDGTFSSGPTFSCGPLD